MGYRIVDMSADPRSGQFAYFRGMTFPFAGITAEVDITDLLTARNGRPFFLNLEKELADMTRQWNESEKEF